MAFDYTNLYPDTSANGGYTKSWNYTTVTDSIATCSASGYFNKVATRLGIGDNIIIARVDAFDTKNRTALVEYAELFVNTISGGVVTTINYSLTATAYTDSVAALKANIASPMFTGTPAAPTATPGTNTTQIATTAYADAIAALKANLASPTFTGTPAAPTAAVDTNTTQLATTAMVLGQAASATPGAITNTAAVGTSTRFARADHVHAYESTAWTAYTPTITSQSGTITTASATGSFKIIGKIAHVHISATVTTAGTGAGALIATLPAGAPPIASNYVGTSYDSGVSSKSGSAITVTGANTVWARDAASTTMIASGAVINITITYQIA